MAWTGVSMHRKSICTITASPNPASFARGEIDVLIGFFLPLLYIYSSEQKNSPGVAPPRVRHERVEIEPRFRCVHVYT